MMSKRKILSAILALAMVFSAVSAFTFPITASATVPSDVVWKNVFTEDFEGTWTNQVDDEGGSGTKTPNSSGDCNKDDGTNANLSTYTNTGTYLGGWFKRIAQGSGVGPRWIQTKASLTSGYDTSVVKISFDIAKSTNGYNTCTVVAVQGVKASGNSNSEEAIGVIANEQWLLSLEDGIYYGYNGGTGWVDGTETNGKRWYHFDFIIDCDSDTFDVYRDGTKIINGYNIGVDYNSIDSLKIAAKKAGSSNKVYGTYIDNIEFNIPCETYPVTLNTNGGTVNAGNITSYTETVGATLPTNVTKSGATFAGWYDNAGFTGSPVTEISTSETGNKTFYAKWLDFPSVTLVTNGGTIGAGNVTMYEEGVGATLPSNVTRDGYTFGGWYAESDFSGSAVTSIPSNATGNKTFYAKWTTNGTWDKVFAQDFETGSNYDTYFTETASGERTVPDQVDYTNGTGDNLGSMVKRIACNNASSRTLELNEANSPLYTGNAYADKADIVRISFDFAQEAADKETQIRLVGSVGGSTVTTGMTAGDDRFLFAKNGRIYAHDQNETSSGTYVHSISSTFTPEKWYKIVVDINCMTDTYDVYVYDGGGYDGLRGSGYKLPFDFDKIYGITVTAKAGGTQNNPWTATFVDNVRYYVPGDNASISNESYSNGTVTATVNVDANPDFGNTIALAAYYDAALQNFAGAALADVTGASSYNMSISGLLEKPYILKAFVWNFDNLMPSAAYAETTLEQE